ncbi:MAG: ferredoxin-thioredoxin reductase catalytic domain-containing protein [Dehalococcoidales bacterium]|nr:ferredoxin-thioredoxin reductase catalytic domain-containing protein [Dehalococcoidales bacterium]
MTDQANPEEIDRLYRELKKNAESGGYYLNPDITFTKELAAGLLVNEKRYGYQACPCRLAAGNRDEDRDIICPCDYRDPDVTEYGSCYCGLYVSLAVAEGKARSAAIPERRPLPGAGQESQRKETPSGISGLPLPVWRCRVCGYLCARETPPEICPICKAKKERFERFL